MPAVVHPSDIKSPVGTGTMATTLASLLFATISNAERPYWAYGFVPAIIAVFGTDFVFSAGTIFVQKLSHPHEQSVTGALFSTMTQVSQRKFYLQHTMD